ncbi:MAG: hypothetical protein ACYTEX_12290, partial [Planctomycetota bacterium]
MKKEYLSAEFEPTRRDGQFQPDPAEKKVRRFDAKQSELASIRDSVRNEPAITSKEDQPYLGDWIEQK